MSRLSVFIATPCLTRCIFVDELLHGTWCPACSCLFLFSAGHAAMSVGFATLLSVDVALTLLQFCTVQDSLRLYSGNIMYRQLFASTRVDVVLPVIWYIDGISAILHIFVDSCSQGAYFSEFSGEESLHGGDLEDAQEAQQMHVVVCASLYHRHMGLVLSRQPRRFGLASYEVLRYPFSLSSEAEAMSRRG